MKFPVQFFSLLKVFSFYFFLPPGHRMSRFRVTTYADCPRSKCFNVRQMVKAFQVIGAVFISKKMA